MAAEAVDAEEEATIKVYSSSMIKAKSLKKRKKKVKGVQELVVEANHLSPKRRKTTQLSSTLLLVAVVGEVAVVDAAVAVIIIMAAAIAATAATVNLVQH